LLLRAVSTNAEITREQSRDRGRVEPSLCHAKVTAQARTGAVRIEL